MKSESKNLEQYGVNLIALKTKSEQNLIPQGRHF